MNVGVPTELRFTIPGEPVPKGRPRFSVRENAKTGQRFVKTYTDEETSAWEKKVALIARIAANQARWFWSARDRFTVVVTVYREHIDQGGDLDNYLKGVLDGINKIAFPDDRYVRAIGAALKRDQQKPRVEVTVRRIAKGEC